MSDLNAGGKQVVDLLVVVAMDEEAAPFFECGRDVREMIASPSDRGSSRWWLMDLSGAHVLFVRSGIGLVASAVATANALTAWHPLAVVSAGTCGGLSIDARAGDVVVGTRFVYSGADARAFGYELGQVPGQPTYFEADERFVQLVSASRRTGGRFHDYAVRLGLVGSSDVFVAAHAVPQLREDFPGIVAADMESAAIAQVSRDYRVPFISIRGISDLCGPVASDDFDAHVDDAAIRSCEEVAHFAQRLESFQKKR